MTLYGKKVVNAGAWTLGGHAACQAIRFASSIVLARLLLPEAFGVVALATVVWVGLVMTTDIGLQQSIVRSANPDAAGFLDTVWVMQIVQGLLIAMLLIACSGLLIALQAAHYFPANSAYAHPGLVDALVGFALACTIQGLASTNWAMATKRMEVKRILAIEIGCQCLSVAVMVSWARHDPSVHALIAGAICAAVTRTLASHTLLAGPRNSLRVSKEVAREVFRFGRWVFVGSSASFLASSLDKILLGAFTSAETVGVYVIAAQMIVAVHDLVYRFAGRVGLPALSAAYRADPAGLARFYYQARLPTDLFCLAAAGALAVCGPQLVSLLFPPRFADAGTYLAILALSLLGVRFVLLGQVYLVVGNTRSIVLEQSTRVVALVVGMAVGFAHFGVIGAVWGVACSYVVAALASSLFVGRAMGLWNMRRELLAIPLLLIGLLLGLVLQQALTRVSA